MPRLYLHLRLYANQQHKPHRYRAHFYFPYLYSTRSTPLAYSLLRSFLLLYTQHTASVFPAGGTVDKF